MNFDVVVDNSALVEIVARKKPDRHLVHRLSTVSAAAPEILDAEALSTLRRLERSGDLTAEEATEAMRQVRRSPIQRLAHQPLLERAWQMRQSVHSFDSLYIALAEHLNLPLITCDARLAGSNGHDVTFEVYPVS